MKRIFIVEDEFISYTFLRMIITKMGYEVIGNADNGKLAIDKCLKEKPELLIMDIKIFGDMDGIDTVKKIHENVFIPVIYVTASSDHETRDKADQTRFSDFLNKPVTYNDLENAITKAFNENNMN